MMKNETTMAKMVVLLFFIVAPVSIGNAQFLEKLGKRAEKAAERAVERRVERETEEKTDEMLDEVFEGNKDERGNNEADEPSRPDGQVGTQDGSMTRKDGPTSGNEPNEGASTTETGRSGTASDEASLNVYSKFDFVPGDKVLFEDDFSNDFVGDFPASFNTNGGGDLVQIEGVEGKWLRLLPGYNTIYIPDVTDLPAEFTLEYDIITQGLDKKTSSTSLLRTIISENNTFKEATNNAWSGYSFCQYSPVGVVVENKVNGKREIRNDVRVDIRDAVHKKHHMSIAVNGQRYRMWINERKLVDVPRLLPEGMVSKGIKLHLNNTDTSKENIYLGNLKVAEGGVDLRRKLLSEGRISTNAILFNSGSANLQPQSMGVIRQISQVLQQEAGIKLKIIGHTDADGDAAANLELSKKRAAAVKNALVSVYGVSVDRLEADGKGETEPVGDNASTEGKAQNRRVEFIKQ